MSGRRCSSSVYRGSRNTWPVLCLLWASALQSRGQHRPSPAPAAGRCMPPRSACISMLMDPSNSVQDHPQYCRSGSTEGNSDGARPTDRYARMKHYMPILSHYYWKEQIEFYQESIKEEHQREPEILWRSFPSLYDKHEYHRGRCLWNPIFYWNRCCTNKLRLL